MKANWLKADVNNYQSEIRMIKKLNVEIIQKIFIFLICHKNLNYGSNEL